MNAEQAEEGEQHPGDGVVVGADAVAGGGVAVHAGDQEQVDQPADAEQSEGAEPDGAADRAAEVEAVRADEAENPEDVADGSAVSSGHGCWLSKDEGGQSETCYLLYREFAWEGFITGKPPGGGRS